MTKKKEFDRSSFIKKRKHHALTFNILNITPQQTGNNIEICGLSSVTH